MKQEQSKKTFLMGLDLGTSAIKGVVMDCDGNIIAESSQKTSFIYPAEGWIEIDAESHYQKVCKVIRELSAAAPGPISALAMAAASGNTLLTDDKGTPLTNIINWMDQRCKETTPEILNEISVEKMRQITGWPCVTEFPIAHLAWLKDNQPAIYNNASHYCMNTDWILFKLTGKWVMDHSTATTFNLQEQISGKYYQPFLDLLNIEESKLSPLVDSGTVAGKLTMQAIKDTGLSGETKIVTGCFDHPAAARGMGITQPGQLMLSCGTSWVGFFPESDRQKIIDHELLCDPFLTSDNGPWGAIFSVPYIGRTIDWYVDNLIAPNEKDKYRIFDELAIQSVPGADGLKIDLRETPQPIKASRKNISRAVMEGAATLLNEKIKSLAPKGMKFDTAVMVGGPSKSPIWPQIVEEITGLDVSVGSQHAGSKGAALLAGKAGVAE